MDNAKLDIDENDPASKLSKKIEVYLNTIIYPMLKHFPKSEKFSLCQEIKQNLYRALRYCMQFNTAHKNYKMAYLRQIDSELKLQLVLIGIARDQGYITSAKAYQLQTMVKEMGKMVGGLMKGWR